MKRFVLILIVAIPTVFVSCSKPVTVVTGSAGILPGEACVTGDTLLVGDTYAIVKGQANIGLDLISTTTFGIIVSSDEDFLFSFGVRCPADVWLNDRSYNVPLVCLSPGTRFYYASYMEFDNGNTIFGEPRSFTTLAAEEIVDLGLSVKWRAWNLGADSFFEPGDYFAWGDSQKYYKDGEAQEVPTPTWNPGKEAGYTNENYKYYAFDDTEGEWYYSKYNMETEYDWDKEEYVNGPHYDGRPNLETEDDAASQALKGKWRMPYAEEWEELRSECTWKLITAEEGIPGYYVTSKKKGYEHKSIFLPAAGCRKETALVNYGSTEQGSEYQTYSFCGYYWARELAESNSKSAQSVIFNTSDQSVSRTSSERYLGYSIRPVLDDGE